MLLRYTIMKSFRYSPNIWLILLWNIAGAFVNPNCNTINLNKPSLVLNTPFYLSPSFVSDSVNRGTSTAKRMHASLYDWIVYKRGSKAREMKGEEGQRRSKFYAVFESRELT